MPKLINESDLTSSLLYVFYSSAGSGGGGGAQYLGDLLDVTLGTLNTDDILVYDANSQMWVNRPISDFAALPADPTYSVQWNDNGVFGGTANFIYDPNVNRVGLAGDIFVGVSDVTVDRGSLLYVSNTSATSRDLFRVSAASGTVSKNLWYTSAGELYVSDEATPTPTGTYYAHFKGTSAPSQVLIEYNDGTYHHWLRFRSPPGAAQIGFDGNTPGILIIGTPDNNNPATYNTGYFIFHDKGKRVSLNKTHTSLGTAYSDYAQATIHSVFATTDVNSMPLAVYTGTTPMLRVFADSRIAVGSGISFTDTALTMDRGLDKDRVVLRANEESWWSYWLYNASNGFSFIIRRLDGLHITEWTSKKFMVSFNWGGRQTLISDNSGYNTTTSYTDGAVLEVRSASQGSLPAPRVTTAQRDSFAVTPCGLLIYNTDVNKYQYYSCATNTWEDLFTASTFTPADPNYSIQFNNNGAFGGDANFLFDPVNSVFLNNVRTVVGSTDPTLSNNAQLYVRSDVTSPAGNKVLRIDANDGTTLASLQDGNAYVGIGTNTPAVNLHVVGVGQNWSGLIMEGTDYASIRMKTTAGDFMWSVVPTNTFVLYEWSTNRYLMAANTNAQFKVGQFPTTFSNAAVFEVADTGELTGVHMGSLPAPRIDTASRDSIASPDCGLVIFNTDVQQYQYYSCATNSWTAIAEVAPPDKAIQFNQGGKLGGDASFIWDYATSIFRNSSYTLLGITDTTQTPEAITVIGNELSTTTSPFRVKIFDTTAPVKAVWVSSDGRVNIAEDPAQTNFGAQLQVSSSFFPRITVVDTTNNITSSLGANDTTAYVMSGSPSVPFGFGSADSNTDVSPTLGTVYDNYARNWYFGVSAPFTSNTQIAFVSTNTSTTPTSVFKVFNNSLSTMFDVRDDGFVAIGKAQNSTDLIQRNLYVIGSNPDVTLRLESRDTNATPGIEFPIFETMYKLYANGDSLYILDDRAGANLYQYSGVNSTHWIGSPRVSTPTLDSSAVLMVESIYQGALPAPRMDTVGRDGISTPACGLLIYNTDVERYQYWSCKQSAWVDLSPSPGSAAPPAGAIQYNDGNDNFAGDANLTWDSTNQVLTLAGKLKIAQSGASTTYTPNALIVDKDTNLLGFQFSYITAPFFLLDALTAIQRSNLSVWTYIEPAFFGPAVTPPDVSLYPKTVANPLAWTNTTYVNYPVSYGLWTGMLRADSAYGYQRADYDLTTFTFGIAFYIREEGVSGDFWDIMLLYEPTPTYTGIRINWGATGGDVQIMGELGGADPVVLSGVHAGDVVIVTAKKSSTGTTVYALGTLLPSTGGPTIAGGGSADTNATGLATRDLYIGGNAGTNSNYSSIGLINLWIAYGYMSDTYLRQYHAAMVHKFNR